MAFRPTYADQAQDPQQLIRQRMRQNLQGSTPLQTDGLGGVPPVLGSQADIQRGGPPSGATPNQTRDWFMNAAQGLNVNDQAAFQQFARQNNLQLGRPNAAGMIDTINVPDPSVPGGMRNIDVIQGAAGGQGKLQWGDWGVDPQGRSFGGQGAGGGGGGGGLPGAQPSGGGGGFNDQIRALLMQQLQGASQPISANDPTIAGELQAQERGLERNRQDRRAAMAERAASQGLLAGGASSGAFDTDVASGFEEKGQALSGLRAQVFQRELQSRRQQMSQMLGMALQSGDTEAARALQLQMVQMDNELRRAGLGEQARQWNDQFGLAGAQFQYGKDKDLALFGAGG